MIGVKDKDDEQIKQEALDSPQLQVVEKDPLQLGENQNNVNEEDKVKMFMESKQPSDIEKDLNISADAGDKLNDSKDQDRSAMKLTVQIESKAVVGKEHDSQSVPNQNEEFEGGVDEPQTDVNSGDSDGDEDDEEIDSDDDGEFTIDHLHVDFRHVFLQAQLQNILGKPKH